MDPERITLRGTKGSLLIENNEVEAGERMLEEVLARSQAENDQAICTWYLALAQKIEGFAQLRGRRRVRGRERQLAMIELAEGQRQTLSATTCEIVEMAAVTSVRGRPRQEGGAARRQHDHVGAPVMRGLAERPIELGVGIEDLRACRAAERAAGGHDIGAENEGPGEREGLDEQAPRN